MEWKARTRKYDLERRRLNNLEREEVLNHPLKSASAPKIMQTVSKPDMPNYNQPKPEFEDPLSRFAAEASMQNDERLNDKNIANGVLVNDLVDQHNLANVGQQSQDDGFQSWSQKQSQILSTFTTSQKLSLVALSSKKEVATKVLPSSVTEKVKTRLEQLDELEEGFEHETLSLTQEEYVNHINRLGGSLISAWKEDQRVKTLKIAIQCAKLLGDTSSKQFYPSKFVIVSEILENFGRLVFERLLEKAASSSMPILSATDVNPDLTSDAAKETCRNWFYKIASIRELLPRIYIEASILRCMDFLEQGAAELALDRLVKMARGVAEPLVATYLRCYLARVGDSISDLRVTKHRGSFKKLMVRTQTPLVLPNPFVAVSPRTPPVSYLLESLSDTIFTLNSPPFCLEYSNKIKYNDPESRILKYFVPALEWVTRCLARCVVSQGLSFEHFDKLFELSSLCKDHGLKSLIIGCAVSHLPHSFVAERAVDIKNLISKLEVDDEEISALYSQLGSSLSKDSDPPEADRRPLLNDVWRALTLFDRPWDYVACARVWSVFVARHFGRKEVNVVMGDAVRKLVPDRAFEAVQGSLREVMGHFMGCGRLPLVELVALPNFLPFLDMVEGEMKALVCKDILKKYSEQVRESRSGEKSSVILSDPVIIHSFVTLCKHLHEQVSAVSVDDEVRLIGRLISDFIGTVQKESNSSQLQFYVECRANFCNIDPVLIDLVHRVNKLAMDKRSSRVMKGQLGEDGAFLRACSAYCFITIPSLNGVFHRQNLYLISGQVALQNGCLAQADSFFRSAMKLIAEVPRLLEMDGRIIHTEGMLLEFVRNLCSSLLVLPDPPNRPPLFHFCELLDRIESYDWDQRFDSRLSCYCAILLSLASQSQSSLPYKVPGVDSNDALYGSDPKFLAEIDRMASKLLSRIISYLDTLDRTRVAVAAAAVTDQLLCHSELDSCVHFFKTLWANLGAGNWKNSVIDGPTRSPHDTSVSSNLSQVLERVKRLASEEPAYNKFLSLMIS